jgi:hypothetical protein
MKSAYPSHRFKTCIFVWLHRCLPIEALVLQITDLLNIYKKISLVKIQQNYINNFFKGFINIAANIEYSRLASLIF